MSETTLSPVSLAEKASRYFPLMVLLFIASTASFTLWSGAFLLGIHPKMVYLITTWCIVFGIYGINRYTDIEDYINDSGKREFFIGRRKYLYLSFTILFGSVLWLLAAGSLQLFHVLCLYTGIAYSFPIFPRVTKKIRIQWQRLKEIPFVKSVLVAFLFGSSFFALYFRESAISITRIELTTLMFASVLSVFINTVFCDIRDIVGDKAAGVKTIPVLLNSKRTIIYCITLPGLIWLATAIALYSLSFISLPIMGFIICVIAYPAFYMGIYYAKVLPDRITFLIADSCLLVFGIGLIVLKMCL